MLTTRPTRIGGRLLPNRKLGLIVAGDHEEIAAIGSKPFDVRLTVLNGPKGGIDKQCSTVVTPPGLGTLCVDEQAAGSYTATDAAATLKKSLARSLERAKTDGPR